LRAIFLSQSHRAMRLTRPLLICSYCPCRPASWGICFWFGIGCNNTIPQSHRLQRSHVSRFARTRYVCIRNNANWFIDRLYQILFWREYVHRAADNRRDMDFDIAFHLDICWPCMKQVCHSHMREVSVEWAIRYLIKRLHLSKNIETRMTL